jgi:hypothetical protein
MKTVSLVFAVLLGPGLCLGIQQTQSTQLSVGDQVLLHLGLQAGDVLQNLAVDNQQVIEGVCGEGLIASIGGMGHASSDGAEIGVLRSLDLADWQGQFVGGPCAPKQTDHNLTLAGMLSLGMDQGSGHSTALQQLVIQSDQGSGNFVGTLGATSSVLGLQNTTLTGMARPLDGTETRMQVETVQSQLSL